MPSSAMLRAASARCACHCTNQREGAPQRVTQRENWTSRLEGRYSER
jgi:hypothetical protein